MPTTTTRKGLAVPLVTDAAGNNYNVGPAGRTIVTTGKVRDIIGANATLLDGFVEYNINEPITGKWDFQAPYITEFGSGQLFTNNTGGARAAGDVVMIDPAVDSSIILPNAVGVSAGRVGVVAEAIAGGAVGRVAFDGFIRVKVTGGVTRNQYLTTQNASAIAAGGANSTQGAFAISVTVQDGANTVLALLHPAANLEGGGQINGNVGIGVGPVSYAHLYISGSVNAGSTVAYGIIVQDTLVAQVNGDSLYGLYVGSIFNDNSKTGVIHTGIFILAPPNTGSQNSGITIGGYAGQGTMPVGLVVNIASTGNPYGLFILTGGGTNYVAHFQSNGGAGTNNGVRIQAGSNASDYCFRATAYNAIDYFSVRGDGLATFQANIVTLGLVTFSGTGLVRGSVTATGGAITGGAGLIQVAALTGLTPGTYFVSGRITIACPTANTNVQVSIQNETSSPSSAGSNQMQSGLAGAYLTMNVSEFITVTGTGAVYMYVSVSQTSTVQNTDPGTNFVATRIIAIRVGG